MPSRLFSSFFVALLVGASAFAEQPLPAEEPEMTSKTAQSVLPLEDLRVFTKAYEHIRSAYIHEIDDKTLLEHAIRGMLDQLDPHSSYLDASSFDDLQVHTTGEFGGLGIEVGMEDGFVKVISPIDGTPAQRAGIEAGDLIIKIDDTTLKGLSLNDAVSRMRGPKGSKIVLTIVREGQEQPFDVTLERDTIKVRSVRTEVMDKSFLYLRVAQFQVDTGQDVNKSLADNLKKHDLKGVILDLRNNPGGVLQASVDVADAFLDGGKVVYTEGRMTHSNLNYQAEPGDLTQGLPLVVLINEGSASASEIVAGALQDHRRALVIGTRSFGKGSVQTVIPITDDKAVKLTTALYFTPNGRSIQAQGIEPDLVVERAELTTVKGRPRITEAQLAGHLDNAKGGKDIKSQERESERDLDTVSLQAQDNQLYEALNLLKGLTFFKAAATPKPEPVPAAP
jgi:carboxyl-terminal processing protease